MKDYCKSTCYPGKSSYYSGNVDIEIEVTYIEWLRFPEIKEIFLRVKRNGRVAGNYVYNRFNDKGKLFDINELEAISDYIRKNADKIPAPDNYIKMFSETDVIDAVAGMFDELDISYCHWCNCY